MRVIFRLFVAFLILFFVFMIFTTINGEEKEDVKKEISKRHCDLDWNKAADSIKEKVLNEFIDNNGIDPVDRQVRSPSMVAAELLPNYVKYPNTIIIDDKPFESYIYFPTGTIKDLDEGVVTFSKNFTSENKLSMKVKSYFIMTVKYQAGCKNFELIDFIVE